MYFQLDAIDFISSQFVFVSQLNTAVDRGVHHDSAREWFISISRNLERFTELLRNVVVVASNAHNVRPSVLCFQTLLGAREVLRSQQRRRESILRGAPRMKTLSH